jgi:hypothetical protein
VAHPNDPNDTTDKTDKTDKTEHPRLPSTDVCGVDASIVAGIMAGDTGGRVPAGEMVPLPPTREALKRHLEKFMPMSGHNLPRLQKMHTEAVMQVWDMYYPREDPVVLKKKVLSQNALKKKVLALRRRGKTVEDISEELEVSVETVFEMQA